MTDENSITYKILHEKSLLYFGLRFVIFAPIGFAIGYLFWDVTLENTNTLSGLPKIILKWLVVGAFALGCAFIPLLRCLSFISIVNLGFGEGQSIVQLSIMVAITDVLIGNLMINFARAKESMKCNMLLAQNFSRTRYEIVHEPTKDMIYNMAAGSMESQRVVGGVEDVFEPLDVELTDNDETNRLEKEVHQDLAKSMALDKGDELMTAEKQNVDPVKAEEDERERDDKLKKFKSDIARRFSKKMMLRCETIWDKAYGVCYDHIIKINKQCNNIYIFPIINLIIPLLCSFIHPRPACYFFRLLKKRDTECFDSEQGIVAEMKALEKDLASSALITDDVLAQFEVNVQFEAQIPKFRLKIYSIDQAFSRIDVHFAWLNSTLGIVKTLCIVARMLLVAYSLFVTYKWLKSYLTNVTHENILITQQFLSIDYRRQLERRQCFGEFKKFEKKRVILKWYQPRLSKKEMARMAKGVFDLMLIALFVIIFTTSAQTFYNILFSVYTYSHFEAQQVGYHLLTMKVKGSGFLAKIIGTILQDFNQTVEVNQTLDNEECRVIPLPVNWSLIDGVYWIWVLFCVLLVQKFLFAYLTRIRIVFADLQYPERKTTRVLWLYNDMLDKRYKQFYHAKDAMESWVDEPEKIPQEETENFLLRVSPKLCGWLKLFAKQPCFICKDETNSKNKSRFCKFHNIYFCDDCLGSYPCFKQCYACLVLKWRQNFYAPTVVKVPLGRRAKFRTAGFLVCREALNGCWQFLLLQNAKNPINWSPPKGIVKPDEDPYEAAKRVTYNETGLQEYEYVCVEASEDCAVYPKADVGYKKVTYWIVVLNDPDKEVRMSPKHINYDWFDVERACKFALYQNCPSAFLKADYNLRKVAHPEEEKQ